MMDWMSAVFTGPTLAFAGIFVAVGLCCVGSAKGLSLVGEAGAGLMTEDPSKFTQVLILQILPSTNGIYGFVAGMLVMVQLDLFGGGMIDITPEMGGLLFFTCLPIGIVGIFGAITQARVAAGVVSLVAKRPEELAKGILICVMIEFFTIVGLLVTILLLFSLPL